MHTNGTRSPATRRCKTCRTPAPAGALVHGECPTCAGLLALPLRGAGGRFLTFAPPKPEPIITDPDPDLCCGVPARITEDDDGRTEGRCTECGSLLWRQIDTGTDGGKEDGR